MYEFSANEVTFGPDHGLLVIFMFIYMIIAIINTHNFSKYRKRIKFKGDPISMWD